VVTESDVWLAGRRHRAVPLFVGGVGRTGSRLTRDLLARSPEAVALTMEMKFISWPAGLIDLAHQPAGPSKMAALARWWVRMFDFSPSPIPDELGGPTTNWGYRATLGRDAETVGYRDAVTHAARMLAGTRLAVADRRTVVAELVHWLLDRSVEPGATHWIEQTPANIDRADDLLATFPDARLLNVIRDPRDVAASITRAWWGPDDPTVVAANLVTSWQRWQRFMNTSPRAERAEVVRFEDLRATPDEVCRRLWSTMGCQPSADIVSIPDPDRSPAAFADLDPATRQRVETIVRPVLAGQGY
jgi:hypothetical protein